MPAGVAKMVLDGFRGKHIEGNRVVRSVAGDTAAFLSNTLALRNVVKRHADFLSALYPAEIREYQSMGIASLSVWNSTIPWRTKIAT